MSEKLCLQWNDFQENIESAFVNLREDNDFTDVTLACEDGQQVEAHKVILAASSHRSSRWLLGILWENPLHMVKAIYHGKNHSIWISPCNGLFHGTMAKPMDVIRLSLIHI